MNLFSRIKNLFSSPSYPRTLAMIGILIIIIALPITVFVLQQRTNIFQHAAGVCDPTGEGCGGEGGGCIQSLPANHWVTFDYSKTCTPINCVDHGLVAGQCGYNPPPPCTSQTFTGECHEGQVCTLKTFSSSCNKADQWSNCVTVAGQCGASNNPPPPTQNPHPQCGNGSEVGTCQSSCDANTSHQITVSGCPSGNTICCVPGVLDCQNPAKGGSSSNNCYTNNSCATGMHQVDLSCGTAGRICCAPGAPAPWYDCQTSGALGGNIQEHDVAAGTTNIVGQCTNIQICQNNVVYPQGSGDAITSVKSQLCVAYNFDSSKYSTGGTLGIAGCASNSICIPPNGTTTTGSSCQTATQDNYGQAGVTNLTDKTYIALNYQFGKVVGPASVSNVGNLAPNCGAPGSGRVCCDPKPTCANVGGQCQASHTTCSNGTVRNLDLDATCGTTPGSNEICCAPSSSITATPPTTTTGTTVTPPSCPAGTNCGGGSPSPSQCTPGQSTSFALAVKLQGIGSGSFENNNPLHPTRTAVYVRVTDESGSKIYDKGDVQFTYSNGTFNAPTIDLGTSATCGHTYTVTVKLPMYVKASNAVTYGKTGQPVDINPIPGDINLVTTGGVVVGDDFINVNDYAMFRDNNCHKGIDPNATIPFTTGSTTVNVKCSDLINLFDYQDGGTQGDEWGFNYNLWLKGFFQANGFK